MKFVSFAVIWLLICSCDSTPMVGETNENVVVNNISEDVEKDQEVDTADEPAMIAGSYLTCSSIEVASDAETVGCSIKASDNKDVDLSLIDSWTFVAITNNERTPIEPLADRSGVSDSWQFIFSLPRNIEKIEVKFVDKYDTEYGSSTDIGASETPRFAKMTLPLDTYFHIGNDENENGANACAQNDLGISQRVYQGTSTKLSFSLSSATLVRLSLSAVCEVNENESGVRLLKQEGQELIHFESATNETRGAFFNQVLEPGNYEIEILSGGGGGLLNDIDDWALAGLLLETSLPVSTSDWINELDN